MKQYRFITTILLLFLVSLPIGSGYAQECIASGDVDCSSTLSIADLTMIIDFFDGSHAEPPCAWQMDVNGDCLVDRVDFQLLKECLDGPDPDCPTVTTCCDPVVNLTCCQGDWRGDANNNGEDIATIGDISIMIDAKFVTNDCDGLIPCLDEADVNASAPIYPATCDDITIGDIAALIDFRYITGPIIWEFPVDCSLWGMRNLNCCQCTAVAPCPEYGPPGE